MPPAPLAETSRGPADRWLHVQVETSGPRSGEAGCPRLCKPPPSHPHRAFRSRGSARWSVQGASWSPPFSAHLRLRASGKSTKRKSEKGGGLPLMNAVRFKHGGTQLQTSGPNLLVDNLLCRSGWDGLRSTTRFILGYRKDWKVPMQMTQFK